MMKRKPSFLQAYLRKLPLGLLLSLTIFGVMIFLFGYITHEVLLDKEEQVDHSIFRMLSTHVISDRNTSFMKGVSFFASENFLRVAYALIVLGFLWKKNFKRAVEVSAVGIGGFLVNYYMKLFFQRPRPADPLIEPINNFSFPSGHATSAFIFYGLLVYLVWKSEIPLFYKYLCGVLLGLFALLIGFSRVYLRVHYPSDVAAGCSIGIAWLLLCIFLMSRLKKWSDAESRGKAARDL